MLCRRDHGRTRADPALIALFWREGMLDERGSHAARTRPCSARFMTSIGALLDFEHSSTFLGPVDAEMCEYLVAKFPVWARITTNGKSRPQIRAQRRSQFSTMFGALPVVSPRQSGPPPPASRRSGRFLTTVFRTSIRALSRGSGGHFREQRVQSLRHGQDGVA